MEPHLDMNAAFACAFSLSPVVLALHWGTEWNEARDRCQSARQAFEMERLRLVCGEGCLLDYQEAEEELMLAQQAAEDFRNFRVAGATRKVVSQLPGLARVAPRRVPQAVMQQSAQLTQSEAAGAEAEVPSDSAALQDKMSRWETEGERRAKTLGGNLPLVRMMPGREMRMERPKEVQSKKGTALDGFDIGMALSAVVLVPLTLAVFAFPFFIDGIDINSVGPPPMQ
jgi:hypothetical protein